MNVTDVRNRLSVQQRKQNEEYQDARAALAELVESRGHKDPLVAEAKRKVNALRDTVSSYYDMIRLAR